MCEGISKTCQKLVIGCGQISRVPLLLAQGEDIVPISGTKRRVYLEQNAAACAITLSPDDLQRLEALTPPSPGPRSFVMAL